MGALGLKNIVIRSSLVAVGFLESRCLRVAESLPWSLTRDIDAQIRWLQSLPKPPKEEVAQYCWRLLKAGFPEEKLNEALELLAEANWTSKGVEQAHGSLAAINKLHKAYMAWMLSTRAMVHQQRARFSTDPENVKQDKAETRIKKGEEPEPCQGWRPARVSQGSLHRGATGSGARLRADVKFVANTGDERTWRFIKTITEVRARAV